MATVRKPEGRHLGVCSGSKLKGKKSILGLGEGRARPGTVSTISFPGPETIKLACGKKNIEREALPRRCPDWTVRDRGPMSET